MKRALFLAVLMVGLLSNPTAVTAGSPEDPAGVAPSDSVFPPAEHAPWRVLDACAETPPLEIDADHASTAIWRKRMDCGEAARRVVEAGTDADRDRLWSLFDAVPNTSPLTEDVVEAFLARDVERALAGLGPARGPARIESVIPGIELPAHLRDAPDEMQQAWRFYQSIVQTRQTALDPPPDGTAIAFQSNQPAFRRAVAEFLRGRVSPADIARDVSRYEWAGHCGTGSEILHGPKMKALILAHLQLGNIDLALAAAEGGLMRSDDWTVSADPRLLTAAGVDWERFHLGAVLSDRMDSSATLARRGSNRAARSLLTYARILNLAGEEAPRPSLAGLLSSLAAFVEPAEAAGGLDAGSESREVSRAADAEPIGADVQQGVLELLAAQVEPNAGWWEATTASNLLVELGRPESRPAFRAMLRSPYEEVRKRGTAGLRAFGETVADPPPSRPVAFRLVVDGRPLRSKALYLWLEKEDGGSETSSAHTDDAGVVELERDSFVDPRRRVVSIRLDVRDLDSAETDWFEIKSESLHDLDAVTTVSIRTGVLTVEIPSVLLDGAPSPTLTLLAVRDPGPEEGESQDDGATPITGDLPVVSTRFTFPRLQHGRYKVSLSRGPDTHESPLVEVGPEPATTTVSVDPIYSTDEEPEERAANPTNQPL